MRCSRAVANEEFLSTPWTIDDHMRNIPDHYHAHARPPYFWRRPSCLATRRRLVTIDSPQLLEDSMGALDGRVAIITGAGRGIGREHALLFAAEGAKVVVNDLGGALDGSSSEATPAEEVVAEIRSFGGEAIANHDNVATWDGGERLVRSAVEHFGDLHVLVNNAGILRDRVIVNLSEEDWDAVISVHLKGHFVPTRHAAAYWREQAKVGKVVKASIINTSSTSGLLGNVGQSNYGAAKAGIAAFTVIAAEELGRYGVRVNAIAPAARTRMTESTPGSLGLRGEAAGPRGL